MEARMVRMRKGATTLDEARQDVSGKKDFFFQIALGGMQRLGSAGSTPAAHGGEVAVSRMMVRG